MSDREVQAKKILDQGIAHVKQGNTHQAIQRFLLVTSVYPESDVADNAHYNLGQVYMKEGKHSQAYAEFKTIMDLYPKSDAAIFAGDMMEECKHQADPCADLFEEAQASYIRGDLEGSKNLYLRLVRDNPDSDLADNAHFALGMIGKRLDDASLRDEHFKIVRERYPDSDAAKLLSEVEAS